MKSIAVVILFTLLQVPSPSSKPPKHDGRDNQTQVEKPPAPQSPPEQASKLSQEKPVLVTLPPVVVKKDWSDYLAILASLLLTLATFFIAIYAAVQARAAKQSADAYERTVRLTERADVLLNSVGIVYPEPQYFNGHEHVVAEFRNFGRTRANNINFNVSLTVPDLQPSAPADVPVTILAPDDVQSLRFGTFRSWLTKETFDNVSQGLTELRFDAKVAYTDIFDLPHATECGGVFMPKDRTFRIDYNRAS
jgi:hypothetical protein